MNTTNINILTLLSQDKFSLEELNLYLNLEKNSIKKDIQTINNFLKDERLPMIKYEKKLYSFQVTKEQWINIINKKNFLTRDEILDYLYIKFIFKGSINLENERKLLDISRSSINRYFKTIKNILLNNETIFHSVSGKGIYLKNLSKKDQRIFCKKLMKNFIKSNITFNKNHLIYSIINKIELDELTSKLKKIFEFVNFSPNYFFLSFFIALYICNSISIVFKVENKYNYEEYKNLNHFIKKNLKNLNVLYQEQLLQFLVSLINGNIEFDSTILNKTNVLIKKIKEKFNIKNLPISLEKMLIKKICFSIFKYKNKILKTKRIELSQTEVKILDFFNDLLYELNLNLYYNDKLLIVTLLEEIILINNKHLCENILLLFDENIIIDNENLKKDLKKCKFNIEIESNLFYILNPLKYKTKYDLIITDDFTLDNSVLIVKSYTFLNIIKCIENYILNEYFKNIN